MVIGTAPPQVSGLALGTSDSPSGTGPDQPEARPGRSPITLAHTRTLNLIDVVLAGGIALLVAALAWTFRASIVPIDPWDYVEGARNFPDGQWNIAGLTRWGMIAPNLVATWLWGNSELTYYAWPILTACLLAASLFLLGTRLASRWAGLAGAGLLAVPVLAVHATRGYPDLAATSLVAASLLALIVAGDLSRAPASTPNQLGRAGLLLLAGLLCGWAFETRETSAFTWPALAVALLRVRRPVTSILLFALPALAWLTVDLVASAHYYGDALLKFHATAGDLTTSVVAADAKYLGHSRAWYAAKPIQMLFDRSGGPALVALMVVGLLGGLLLWRRLWPTLLWGLCAFLPLWWAGGLGDPAHPSIRLDIVRYSLAFAVPFALTGILVIALLCQHRLPAVRIGAAGIAIALGLSLAIPTVRFATTFPGFTVNDGTSLVALRQVIAAQPDVRRSVVWSDWATQRLAPIYSNSTTGEPLWRAEQFRSLNRLIDRPSWEVPQWPAAGDFVIIHSPTGDTCYYCRKAYEEVAAVHPLPQPGWQLLHRSRSGNLEVYRIPAGVSWPR